MARAPHCRGAVEGAAFMAAMAAGNKKRIEHKEPFPPLRCPTAGRFVMTMPKRWHQLDDQIAHQLIWHGKGEFSHVHDVVPWPDTVVMPGFMQRYAVPIDQATAWTSPPTEAGS